MVENQAEKLPLLISFMKNIKPSRLIIFFGTCASVDFHNLILPTLAGDLGKFFKLHGKID
jgi:superfamily II DNA/RNA helicase